MGASASVIQEYYKAVDYWADIVGNRDWKLSVWIVGQNDVDLVDRFLEIERSPVGQFDDIFFRFDTPYRGDDEDRKRDDEEYTEQLWQEYAGWFSEKVEEKYDILRALRHDGLLKEEYIPDVSVEHTAGNLWREMLRFKACISRLDDAFFCLYFPPEQERGYSRTGWFGNVLKEGVPQGIRMTTIDLKKNRSIRLGESREVVCIHPQFDMAAALHNRMARSDSGNDLIAPENRFKQQVTVVMDSTQKQDWKLLDREIRKLLDIAQEIKDTNIRISALLIASEACYAIREYKHSMKYSDETVREAEKAMQGGETAGYSYWKMAVSMKAAILTAGKKREEAVALYDMMAKKAVMQKDPYYVMEGYRMCGFLRYEDGKMEQAFEYFLLALAGGSYLSAEIRRSSTFVYAAYLALHTGRLVRAPIDVGILERQLCEWIGEDWKELVDNPDMQQAKARRRGSFFS